MLLKDHIRELHTNARVIVALLRLQCRLIAYCVFNNLRGTELSAEMTRSRRKMQFSISIVLLVVVLLCNYLQGESTPLHSC